MDIARPSPATGWLNAEHPSFLDRARGRFDLVLMLALVHHLLVFERIPLDEVLALAGELTRDAAIIEFVAPHDPMFQRIARGRDDLFTGLTLEAFESACKRHFEIVTREALEGTQRCLFLLRKRAIVSGPIPQAPGTSQG